MDELQSSASHQAVARGWKRLGTGCALRWDLGCDEVTLGFQDWVMVIITPNAGLIMMANKYIYIYICESAD